MKILRSYIDFKSSDVEHDENAKVIQCVFLSSRSNMLNFLRLYNVASKFGVKHDEHPKVTQYIRAHIGI